MFFASAVGFFQGAAAVAAIAAVAIVGFKGVNGKWPWEYLH